MANINLVTGYTGEAHIKSEEDALLNSFLSGQNYSLIDIDSTFNDTDCDVEFSALVSGRLMKTDESVNLTFTKPSSGYYRKDGIYAVYKKVTDGTESAELVYCEGTQNATESSTTIGEPIFGGDVTAHNSLLLYTITWDNAQTKTVTQNIAEGTLYDAFKDAFFEDGESVIGDCWCSGVLALANPGGSACTLQVTLPLPKTLRAGQTLTPTFNSFGADLYYHDGTNFAVGVQTASVLTANSNCINLQLAPIPNSSSKVGLCVAKVHYNFTVTR